MCFQNMQRSPRPNTFVKKNGCSKIMENINCVDLHTLQMAVQMWGPVRSRLRPAGKGNRGWLCSSPLGTPPSLVVEGFPLEFDRESLRSLLEATRGSEVELSLGAEKPASEHWLFPSSSRVGPQAAR